MNVQKVADWNGRSNSAIFVVSDQSETLGCALAETINHPDVLLYAADRPHPLATTLHIRLAVKPGPSTPNSVLVEVLKKTELYWKQFNIDMEQAIFASAGKTTLADLAAASNQSASGRTLVTCLRATNTDIECAVSGMTYENANALRRASVERVGGVYVAYEAVVRKNTSILDDEALCRRVSHVPLQVNHALRGTTHEETLCLHLNVTGLGGSETWATSSDLTSTDASVSVLFPNVMLVPLVNGQTVDISFRVKTDSPQRHALFRAVSSCSYMDQLRLMHNPRYKNDWSHQRLARLAARINYCFEKPIVSFSDATCTGDDTDAHATSSQNVAGSPGLEVAPFAAPADLYCTASSILQDSKTGRDDAPPLELQCSNDVLWLRLSTDGRRDAAECLLAASLELQSMLQEFKAAIMQPLEQITLVQADDVLRPCGQAKI